MFIDPQLSKINTKIFTDNYNKIREDYIKLRDGNFFIDYSHEYDLTSANGEFPTGFSPNNDGLNDTWNLSGLNAKKVQIFNRYGVEVYSKNNYTDEWDGRTDSGEELPTATYYYVLTFSNGTVKTGWVYLNRVN